MAYAWPTKSHITFMFLKWGSNMMANMLWALDYKLKQMPKMGIEYWWLASSSLAWTLTTQNQSPHKSTVDLKLGS
jgi:hypothetical protein